MSRARAALLGVLLLCAGIAAHQLQRPNLADFQVYDTAAGLVHEHQSAHIYDDADTGQDPQLKFANPQTVFAQEAARLGVSRVRLYVYPPILADLLVPFSLVSAAAAGKLWLFLNLCVLLVAGLLTLDLLGGRKTGPGVLAAFAGLLVLFSTSACLVWGQITIVLLLLWTAGIYFYARGKPLGSAICLALATAIKLTPLLVVVPFFVWRDWRWLRNYALAMAAAVVLMVTLNGPASLADYFLHVTPSMSRGVPNYENKSLPSEVQVVWSTLRGGAANAEIVEASPRTVMAGKAVSLLVLLATLAVMLRSGRALPEPQRVLVLAAVALLATCASPVSWKHAYEPCFLLLALLWGYALRRPVSVAYLAVLTLGSIELGSFLFDSVALKLFHAHGPVMALCALLAPGAGVAMCLLAAATTAQARGAQAGL